MWYLHATTEHYSVLRRNDQYIQHDRSQNHCLVKEVRHRNVPTKYTKVYVTQTNM